jgi:hypothetical protein
MIDLHAFTMEVHFQAFCGKETYELSIDYKLTGMDLGQPKTPAVAGEGQHSIYPYLSIPVNLSALYGSHSHSRQYYPPYRLAHITKHHPSLHVSTLQRARIFMWDMTALARAPWENRSSPLHGSVVVHSREPAEAKCRV